MRWCTSCHLVERGQADTTGRGSTIHLFGHTPRVRCKHAGFPASATTSQHAERFAQRADVGTDGLYSVSQVGQAQTSSHWIPPRELQPWCETHSRIHADRIDPEAREERAISG